MSSKMGVIEVHIFPSNIDPNISTETSGMTVGSNTIWLKLPANLGWVRSPHRSAMKTCSEIKNLFEEENK